MLCPRSNNALIVPYVIPLGILLSKLQAYSTLELAKAPHPPPVPFFKVQTHASAHTAKSQHILMQSPPTKCNIHLSET